MKLKIGDKVNYHYPENSFPPGENNGRDYTGIITGVRRETTHDRATMDIDSNTEHLVQIECNQEFISIA